MNILNNYLGEYKDYLKLSVNLNFDAITFKEFVNYKCWCDFQT